MRLREEAPRTVALALLSAPPIAFMAFDFFFPNLSTPSLNKNLMLVFLISILTGVPSGYFSRRLDAAMVTVLLYVSLGYILGLTFYSVPFLFYNIHVLLPGFYYMIFVRYTIILLFMFVLGGFIGAVFSGMLRDSVKGEETKLTFQRLAKR